MALNLGLLHNWNGGILEYWKNGPCKIPERENPEMIQVENLTKYYHALCAVDQINFDI